MGNIFLLCSLACCLHWTINPDSNSPVIYSSIWWGYLAVFPLMGCSPKEVVRYVVPKMTVGVVRNRMQKYSSCFSDTEDVFHIPTGNCCESQQPVMWDSFCLAEFCMACWNHWVPRTFPVPRYIYSQIGSFRICSHRHGLLLENTDN